MGKRILILDENNTRKNNISSRLRAQGFELDLARGGFHALHLLEKHSISLTLMFESMHDMPTEEVVGLIRTTVSKKQIPIIYISKKADSNDLPKLFDQGINDFIIYTPTFLKNLLDKINKLI